MKTRILIDSLIFLTIMFLPPIVPLVLSLFFLFYFKSFYEIIFVGLIIDSLYMIPMRNYYNFSNFITVVAAILFLISIFIKKHFNFYVNKLG